MTLILCNGKRGVLVKWFSFVKKTANTIPTLPKYVRLFHSYACCDESIIGKYYTLIDKGK